MIEEFQAFSRPATRSVSDAEFQSTIHHAVEQLEKILQFDPSFFSFSLWEAEKEEFAGYCIVELRDRNPIFLIFQAFLIEIGILEKYRGGFYWASLLDEACRNVPVDYQWLGASVTVTNSRSLKTALRFAKFKTAGYQWVKSSKEPFASEESGVFNLERVSYQATENLEQVIRPLEKNYPLRFPEWMHYSQNEILNLKNQWVYELRQLLNLHRVGILTAARKEEFCYAVLALNQAEASTGEIQGVVLDISLEKSVWETGLVQRLLEKMREICERSNQGYLVVNLPPGYETYMDKWGYQRERFHIVRKLEHI